MEMSSIAFKNHLTNDLQLSNIQSERALFVHSAQSWSKVLRLLFDDKIGCGYEKFS